MENLRKQQKLNTNKTLRKCYDQYFEMVKSNLSEIEGTVLEIGSGQGTSKEYIPDIVTSDIKSEFVDLEFDAHKIPLEDKSCSNIICVDTIHHLYNPLEFFDEALRVLKSGGRVIMIEPYPSPTSLLVYKLFHDEPFEFEKDYFDQSNLSPVSDFANQAIPFLLFFKNSSKFEKKYEGKFSTVSKTRFSFLLFPLSGGFRGKNLIPSSMINAAAFFEKKLAILDGMLSFRCLVVIEKV